MKRLTLKEIGQLAGVSRATVSRVINNHPNISTEVRNRVQRVIAETGYQPNRVARSLASRQSQILGLVIPSVIQAVFTDPYYPHLTQGISQACNEHGYILTLFLFHTPDDEKDAINHLAGNGLLDGFIITADNIIDPIVPHLLKANVPFVQIGRPQNPEQVSFVDVDNVAGSYLATVHLIQQGRRRIGQIKTAHNSAGVDRDVGFRKALAERGIPIDESLIVMGDFTEISGYYAMQRLIPQKPDAVFIQSDTMAYGALRALREANLCVPQDIAIVSFDDLPASSLSDPPLTTIRQPIKKSGNLAVETLIDIINTSREPARHIILPVELVIRATCGAVT
jgi:LacI family transcriptional regulator